MLNHLIYVSSLRAKILNLSCEIIKLIFKDLNRTLIDLRNNENQFGGVMILLSDFRQTLPVIPRSTQDDELNACLKSSKLWKHVKVLHLNKNICVMLQNDQSGNIFSK
jgi:nitrogen fixation protein